jgi:hypothetical protein
VVRFPSAVAHALVGAAPPAADDLLLGDPGAFVRPAGFDPARAPRVRSYPGGDDFLRQARTPSHLRVTLCGWLAAAYGADRVLLAEQPSPAAIEALTHKALLSSGAAEGPVDLVYVVDTGVKARVLAGVAAEIHGELTLTAQSFRAPGARRLRFTVGGEVVDAPACAAAVLPPEVLAAAGGGVLLLDVGFRRTKAAVVSREGCVLQTEHEPLGFADCVRRILRDAQDHGLVEDEFAVIRALEAAPRLLAIAGRQFAVGEILDRAVADLADAVARAAARDLADDFGRRGAACGAAAIFGGATPIVGPAIAARLRAADLGLRTIWLPPEPNGLLLAGARRLQAISP